MFCSACGTKNDTAAKFCRGCGKLLADHAPAPVIDPGTMRGVERGAVVLSAPTGKSPVLAAILSLVIVGVGQFYNGDIKKGALMLAIALVFGAATGGLLWLALAIWSAVDAYKVASGTGKLW
jgi:TM2 domain-containing membrane protein YozV